MERNTNTDYTITKLPGYRGRYIYEPFKTVQELAEFIESKGERKAYIYVRGLYDCKRLIDIEDATFIRVARWVKNGNIFPIYDKEGIDYLASNGSSAKIRKIIKSHETNYPLTKLQLVKDIKDITGWGLRESKEFADHIWGYDMSNAIHVEQYIKEYIERNKLQ